MSIEKSDNDQGRLTHSTSLAWINSDFIEKYVMVIQDWHIQSPGRGFLLIGFEN